MIGHSLLSLAVVAVAQEPLTGPWAGRLDVAGHTRFVQLRVEADGATGTIDLGGAAGAPVAVKAARPEPDRVRLAGDAEGTRLQLAGRLDDGVLLGEAELGDAKGSFELRRLVELTPAALEAYEGDYALPGGQILHVQTWGEVEGRLVCLDPVGRLRALHPVSAASFVAGPGLLLPAPLELRVTFERDGSGRVTHLLWQPEGVAPSTAGRIEIAKREEVGFRNGDVELSGWLFTPPGPGPHPALVIVHGSGDQDRRGSLPFVKPLLHHGVALLSYDKRGVGRSGGDWHQAGFEELADDALAAVRFLKGRKAIDATRIGVFGVSQGGWIGPLAAVRGKDVALVISVSGPGTTAAVQESDRMERRLKEAGLSELEVAEVLALETILHEVARSGSGWERLEAALEKAKGRSWQPAVAAQLPPPDHWFWRFWAKVVDYDPVPVLERLRVPVLAIFGGLDQSVPEEKNRRLWQAALARAGHRDHTLRVFPKGNHILLEAGDGGMQEWPRLQRFVPGFFDAIADWLRARGFAKR